MIGNQPSLIKSTMFVEKELTTSDKYLQLPAEVGGPQSLSADR